MQFRLKTLLLLPVVVGGLIVAGQWAWWTIFDFGMLVTPLTHGEKMSLGQLGMATQRYVLLHRDPQWDDFDAMLADLEQEPRVADQWGPDFDIWRLDAWGRPRLLLWDEKNRCYLLRSRGPNGRDEGGQGDDIQEIGGQVAEPYGLTLPEWDGDSGCHWPAI